MKFKYLYLVVILFYFLYTSCKKGPNANPVKTVTQKTDTTLAVKPTDTINHTLILGTWHSVSKIPDYLERYFGTNSFYYENIDNPYGDSFHFNTYVWAKNDTLIFGGVKVKVTKLTTDSLVFTPDTKSTNVYRYYNEHLPLLDPNGQISTLIGRNFYSYSGDGGLASAADINSPYALTLDNLGDIYFFDAWNGVIREITASNNLIHTVAGIVDQSGNSANIGEDGLPALSTHLNCFESAITVGNNNDVYLIQNVELYSNRLIYKISASDGTMHIVCGKNKGYSGDGGPAAKASVLYPGLIEADAAGNLYFSDQLNTVIRKISAADGTITTIAGNGMIGYSGDGGPAKNASLHIGSMAVDKSGDIIFDNTTAAGSGYIRQINQQTGIITTVAGSGKSGYSGDGVDASLAGFSTIGSIAVNKSGDIFIAENTANNHRIRKITKTTNLITTVAGNNYPLFSGDGNYLKIRSMGPESIVIDQNGNLLLCDLSNNRIRKIVF